ncbi:hypothetical protein CY34DRAFT_14175 [Suillus luteus UH-Slu-Lm8-n1]|uniref:Uncharacterized protein n=1 Tax=Suillus luteus UH-Slu-Lm8-n1 TaxID=930992 RepID=A0A0C9ZPV7_9AGAM|nr:hypothetical protein CY34DRAFT_14175 [Suillus luteus UH-Slu-Lm8-n1]
MDALHAEGGIDNPSANVNTIIPDVQIECGADLDDGKIDDGPTEIEAQVQFAQICSTERKRARNMPALAIELSVPHL